MGGDMGETLFAAARDGLTLDRLQPHFPRHDGKRRNIGGIEKARLHACNLLSLALRKAKRAPDRRSTLGNIPSPFIGLTY